MTTGTRSATGFSSILKRFRDVQAQLANFSSQNGMALVNAWLPQGIPCTELRALAELVAGANPTCNSKELSEKVLEMVTEPEIPDLVSDVRIMSLHKSKGLSANVVIVAGCVEGLIPRQPDEDITDAERDEAIEESRRLFFVGLTRVKASINDGRPGHLILSASRSVPIAIAMRSGISISGSYGGMSQTITSRFLGELGPNCPAPVSPAS